MADIDVSPGILEQMNQAIEANDASKRARNRLIVKAEKGQAIYKDAYDYAGLRGKAAADAIREIEESDLPNGRMYFNIADKTIRPVLEETSDEIFSYASQLLENVNEKAGIHLKPVLPNPEETAKKIKGVLGLASSNEHWNEVREETAQTVENFSKKCVDDHIRTNAERQYEAGLTGKVVRTASRGACEWCEDVAGSYEYAAVKGRGEDVWRRHANCDCVIEYEPVKGKRQTVSSGSYRQNKESLSPEERERRAERRVAERQKVRLNSNGDPLAEVTGPAELSHPEEILRFQEFLKANGVELIRRDHEDLGYAPGLQKGEPGQVHISKDASYGAWCHEMQHVYDDKDRGWAGYKEMLKNPDLQAESEEKAYGIEINMALDMNREDIAERLRKNLAEEIERIYHGQ